MDRELSGELKNPPSPPTRHSQTSAGKATLEFEQAAQKHDPRPASERKAFAQQDLVSEPTVWVDPAVQVEPLRPHPKRQAWVRLGFQRSPPGAPACPLPSAWNTMAVAASAPPTCWLEKAGFQVAAALLEAPSQCLVKTTTGLTNRPLDFGVFQTASTGLDPPDSWTAISAAKLLESWLGCVGCVGCSFWNWYLTSNFEVLRIWNFLLRLGGLLSVLSGSFSPATFHLTGYQCSVWASVAPPSPAQLAALFEKRVQVDQLSIFHD